MIQTISCVKCGNTFAACAEPYCYEDADWQRDMRKYVKKGFVVSLVERQDFEFNRCDCKKKNQPELELKEANT